MNPSSNTLPAGLLEQALADAPGCGLLALTKDGRITFWSRGCARLTGYSSDEVLGKDWSFLYPPEQVAELLPLRHLEWARGNGAFAEEAWRLRKDRGRFRAHLTLMPLVSAAGRLLGFGQLIHELSPLRASDEWQIRFQAAVKASRSLYYERDLESGHIFWAGDAVSVTGFDFSELSNLDTWIGRIHPDDRANFMQEVERAVSTEAEFEQEYRFLRKDGRIATVIDIGYSSAGGEDQRPRRVGLVRDVTEGKRLEGQYLQAQKMEAIGRLSGGIAHDFNNLLTVILGHAEMAELHLGTDSEALRYLEPIRTAGLRAAALTSQLLAFARQRVTQATVIDLNARLSDVSRLLRRLLGEDIELVSEFSPELWQVRIDPHQLEQVVINMAVNSRDAMPGGGRFSLETQNLTLDEPFCRAHPPLTPGDYVRLTVSDTGCGISPAVLPRIFEPFFTTKDHGKGTGLGLPTSFGIIQQAGGHIVASSQPGAGASFEIYLPRDSAAIDPIVPDDRSAPPHGRGTVLVVEDETLVRQLAVTTLRAQGYIVLEAEHGPAALSLLEQHGGPIDLLVTDLVLPRMSGLELVEQIRSRTPGVRVLLVSGYSDSIRDPGQAAAPREAFLAKPYTPSALARKVWDVLFQ